MAKTSPTKRGTRGRRTVRDELTNPIPPSFEDSATGEESMSEFHNNEETETPKPASAPRLSLPLTPDGSAVDWERVRNAERARTVLGLNGASEASGEASALFGADMLDLALDVIGGVLVNLTKAAGYTPESCESMRFGVKEKEAITARATKVLSKHAPTLGRWEDEIMLAATLSIVLGGKVMTLKKAGAVSKFPRAVETPEPAATTPVIPE